MKTILREYLRITAVLAYVAFAWPLSALLSRLLGQAAPTALSIAASRFSWRPPEKARP